MTTQYQSPLFNAVADPLANRPASTAMPVTAAPTLKQGPIQNIKTSWHNSRAAGERDRDLATHTAIRETELGKQAIDISYQLASKTLTDQSATELAAADQRLLAKQQLSNTGLFETFSVGMQVQSKAKTAATQQVHHGYQQGHVAEDDARVQLARLSAADRLINESEDRALVASLTQTEQRFAAARSTR